MKKITLERELMVPTNRFCIMWKNRKEVCPMLAFRKEPNNPKMVFKCSFFDKDLDNKINSYGIEKICEEQPVDIDNVVNINEVHRNSI